MWIFTHIQLANACMKQVVGPRRNMMSKLAFVYGNIKPDITEQAYMKHHVELTYETMYDALIQSMDKEQTIESRWRALGVVCHYLADYSCRFHVNKIAKNKSLLEHLHYEWCLHRYIKTQLKRKSEGPLATSESTIEDIRQRIATLIHVKHMDSGNKRRAVMGLIQVYEHHRPSYHTDYIFGATGMWAMTQMVVTLWEESSQVIQRAEIKSHMVV